VLKRYEFQGREMTRTKGGFMKRFGKFIPLAAFLPLLAGCGMEIVKSDDLHKLQSDYSNQITQIQGLQNDLQYEKEQNSSLSNENLSLKNLIDSTKGKLGNEIDSLKSDNSNLTMENQSLQKDLQLQKSQVASLQDARDALQKQVDSISMELTNLKNMVDSTKGNLGGQIDSLKSDINAKNDTILSLNQTISNKDIQIATLRQDIKDISAEKDKLLTQKDLEMSNLAMTSSNLIRQMQDEIQTGDLKIRQLGDELNIDFKDKIFFDLGSADIKSTGKRVLNELVNVLKNITNKQIRVEGYTDNIPIAEQYRWKFPSNWELSTLRATTIVRYLQSKGIDPSLMKATGYGEYNPIVPNDTEADRAQNRRIVILLVPLDVRTKYR
jgi:chemotaxis protein MotB